MSEFGTEIKRLRTEKGWSQAQLAVYSATSQPTVNQIETGKRNPSTETLEKLARALGVEVVDLFPKKVQQVPLWRTEEESEQRREPEDFWQALRQALIKVEGLRVTQIEDPNSRAEWETLERDLKELVAENSALRATVAELREELAKVRETA